ncbi:MAG: SOS response-associated peptidase [Sulfurifustis sp.]
MCGRASTTTPPEQIAALVGARGPFPPWRARYNQPPGEPVANVVESNGVRSIEAFVWGIPGKDPKRPYVNIRGEGVAKSRSFRHRRSLVFVDGFYEWDRHKQPYYVRRHDRRPFALGAVYDESMKRRRFAIITTAPNRTIGQVHNRMPAILPETAWKAWLDPLYPDYDELTALLQPYPDSPLEIYPVSRAVNSPKNDRPELLDPVGEMPRVAQLAARIRTLLDGQREMTAMDIARELRVGEADVLEALNAMESEIDRRGAMFYLTKWKR